MKDDVVPYMDSLAFVERAAHPHLELRLFKGGDHRLLAYKEEMAEAACEFFARLEVNRIADCRLQIAD
jgi:hypothetical protein